MFVECGLPTPFGQGYSLKAKMGLNQVIDDKTFSTNSDRIMQCLRNEKKRVYTSCKRLAHVDILDGLKSRNIDGLFGTCT